MDRELLGFWALLALGAVALVGVLLPPLRRTVARVLRAVVAASMLAALAWGLYVLLWIASSVPGP